MNKALQKLLVYPLPHGVGWPQVLGSLLILSRPEVVPGGSHCLLLRCHAAD